jgi:cytochrome c oxidase assembly protein subunit 11
MPVTFYVDPAIVEDRDAKYAKSITLSYTFYEIDLPQEAQTALLQPERTKKKLGIPKRDLPNGTR